MDQVWSQVEGESFRNEERWQVLFQNCVIGVAVADIDGRVIANNPVFSRILGHAEQQHTAVFLRDLVGVSDFPAGRDLVGAVARAELLHFKVEKFFERGDGTSVWLNLHVSLVQETAHSTRCLMALLEDVSDQKFAEASLRGELKQDRDLLRFVLDLSLDLNVVSENPSRYPSISEVRERADVENLHFHEEPLSGDDSEIVGRHHSVRRVLEQAKTVANTDAAVLLLGETGTGKELIARAIHKFSSRRNRPLVRADCASIPAGLLENELFGHEKGAFTGAIAREIGRFELANDGTLFLDEAGDIPLELQSKLLRVLQEHNFERLGSTRTIQANFRLISATNRDLGQMAEMGRFRRDLYYRLNVFPIHLPPLRERKEDIPLLTWHFIKTHAKKMKKRVERIRREDMEILKRYPWPGNVRELQNVIERSMVLTSEAVLHLSPLTEMNAKESISSENQTLEDAEREHILQALRSTDWVIGGPYGAASRLGIRRTTLLYKMRRLGIFRPQH